MATQRITIAKIGGDGALAIDEMVRAWSQSRTNDGGSEVTDGRVDDFVLRLKAAHAEFPVSYYCEWIDRWSMGDAFDGPLRASGKRFEITCFSPKEAILRGRAIHPQWPEQKWLATRLGEAGAAWGTITGVSTILLIRESIGPSADDEEYRLSETKIPSWVYGDDPAREAR
ncbi:MAG: hypothetical protein ACO1QR_03250 [Chthoniobacteraceae bacterium]